MYLLGLDIGSSSIKAALVEAETGYVVGVTQYPEQEMNIIAHHVGWAEQAPQDWWKYVCLATQKVAQQAGIEGSLIQAIGISYQMHGLVVVDKHNEVLRPSIIWCDSRAVSIGNDAFESIGTTTCLSHLLNSPGNFTASKLKWVKENEPNIYAKIHKIMLPGDYIAMKMTGEICTTISGLSEGILWDFKNNTIAHQVLKQYGIEENLIPNIAETFSNQGTLTAVAAKAMGLSKGIPITYRAGDQPNNALSLGVFNSGEVAATGGTSGVVYGVVDKPKYDTESRVNGFAHVNYTPQEPRIGVLLCINGAGIQYSWTKKHITQNSMEYHKMEQLGTTVPVGCDGLSILPFGNGAERMLGNRETHAHICNLNFNRHQQAHLIRASLEGIAFSFVYGMSILKSLDLDVKVIRVGNDNLFQSNVFAQTISNLSNSQIELIATTGAIGAAKAASVGIGLYATPEEALKNNKIIKTIEPEKNIGAYQNAYDTWKKQLDKIM